MEPPHLKFFFYCSSSSMKTEGPKEKKIVTRRARPRSLAIFYLKPRIYGRVKWSCLGSPWVPSWSGFGRDDELRPKKKKTHPCTRLRKTLMFTGTVLPTERPSGKPWNTRAAQLTPKEKRSRATLSSSSNLNRCKHNLKPATM